MGAALATEFRSPSSSNGCLSWLAQRIMNKDNGFKTERKYFKTYNDAHEWAINNFEKFNHDMISYTEYEKPIKN